jgi:hypothetical protein
MRTIAITAACALLAVSSIARVHAQEATRPISTGKEIVLSENLTPEQPTLFFFYKPNSTLEKAFVADIQKQTLGKPVGVKFIALKTGEEPIAKQYEITETPTVIVMDRRGRQTVKTNKPDEIAAAVRKAADVARIAWLEDEDAAFPEVQKMAPFPLKSAKQIPSIMRTMSLKPEIMIGIQNIAQEMHFADGALIRREKEMIAAYVSALNKCRY